jgi:TBC1 domain family member 2A
MEQHMKKWNKFLKSHSYKETWLWQYWRDDSRPQSQLNKKFLNRFDSKIQAQKKIKELIRHGVPAEHRGAVWWACSGGADKMTAARDTDTFASYLHTAVSVPNPAEHDIMKDLHRTFPCDDEASREGIEPLKRVLLAYSVRNREVGYCQSMNFLVAILLTLLEEEQAFWVLAAIVEDILPRNYYTASMLGCRVDQAVGTT